VKVPVRGFDVGGQDQIVRFFQAERCDTPMVDLRQSAQAIDVGMTDDDRFHPGIEALLHPI